MDMFKLFVSIIIVQAFFAFGVTTLAYALPQETINLGYITAFTDLGQDVDLEGINEDIQSSLDSQLDIPVIDIGALVFYSGNILIDLILNFLFAIPQMIGLLIAGLVFLFNLDSYLVGLVQFFMSILISIMYVIGLIQLLLNIRGRGSTIV